MHLVYKCSQIRDGLRSWYSRIGSSIESLTAKMVAEQDKPSIEHMASAHLLVIYWCCLLHYTEIRWEVLEAGLVTTYALILSISEDA